MFGGALLSRASIFKGWIGRSLILACGRPHLQSAVCLQSVIQCLRSSRCSDGRLQCWTVSSAQVWDHENCKASGFLEGLLLWGSWKAMSSFHWATIQQFWPVLVERTRIATELPFYASTSSYSTAFGSSARCSGLCHACAGRQIRSTFCKCTGHSWSYLSTQLLAKK